MFKKILIGAIISYIVLVFSFCFWKYVNFGYDGLDLAIYNQVFFNSVHGNLFQFTIHPQSYLGDHLELFILVLLPFYYLYQNPLSLLLIQTIFLAFAAWPLFLITKKIINEKIALVIGLLWLLNPFVLNINLFEFHLLPLALPFLFLAFYYYLEYKFQLFIFFIILSLLIREDVSLLTIMFGFLGIIDKRKSRWIWWPFILSGLWFIAALKIIAIFSPDSHYKFLYYYSWLGANFPEIIKNIFLNPILLINHFINWQTLVFLLVLFLPFAFINLFKGKYLLLGVLVLLQLLMASTNNAAVIPYIHYVSLLLIPLFIALIFEIKKLGDRDKLNKFENLLIKEKFIIYLVLGVVAIYTFFTLGPITGIFTKNFSLAETEAKTALVKKINSGDVVLTSFDFLAPLSSRFQLFSLHYFYNGKLQYSQKDYRLAIVPDKILIDAGDFLDFQLLFPNQPAAFSDYRRGSQRIRELIANNNFKVTSLNDSVYLLEKNAGSEIELYRLNPDLSAITNNKITELTGGIQFLGWDSNGLKNNELTLALYFQTLSKIDADYNLRLKISDQNNKVVYQKNYALTYGLYPTFDWELKTPIKINYRFRLPNGLSLQNKKISFALFSQKGSLTLDNLRSTIPEINQENNLGDFLTLPEKF